MQPFFDKVDGKNGHLEVRKWQSVYDRLMLRDLLRCGKQVYREKGVRSCFRFRKSMEFIVIKMWLALCREVSISVNVLSI